MYYASCLLHNGHRIRYLHRSLHVDSVHSDPHIRIANGGGVIAVILNQSSQTERVIT